MTWLAACDCNTKFFHKQAHQRQRMNTISGPMNIVNEWYTDEKQVEDIAVAYFEDLFHTTQPVDMRDTLLAVKNTVTQEVNRTLLKSFTAEEVRLALFQMDPSKAPEPNGMSCFFYQKYCHVVGLSISNAVLSVLNSRKILRKINLAHISLIPKKKKS